MSFDFPDAQLPALKPLKNSVAQGHFETEDQLRTLFLALFDALLANDVFDVNVLGAGHLGSLDLVRKMVNADGLVLLAGAREESATRYIYRAWKSRNKQMRGLHFLRTYLQMLFPNANSVEQMAQHKSYPYPTKLINLLKADENYYSTSRIRVLLNSRKVTWADIERTSPILRDVVAARFLLYFGLLSLLKRKNYVGVASYSGSVATVYPFSAAVSSQSKRVFVGISGYSGNTTTIYPQTP